MAGDASPDGATDAARDRAIFDAHADDYSHRIERALGGLGGDHPFYARVKADEIVRLLGGREPASRARVLDVGCGIGLLHPHLAGRVADVAGVDVSEASLEAARTRNPGLDYRSFDGARLPFADASFDLATVICVLHHVPRTARGPLLGDVVRVVRPGGLVAVLEHNPLNPATRLVVGRCELDRDAELLSPSLSRRLLRAAGCVRIRTRHILFTPFRAAAFRRLDAALAGLALGAQYLAFGRRPAATP